MPRANYNKVSHYDTDQPWDKPKVISCKAARKKKSKKEPCVTSENRWSWHGYGYEPTPSHFIYTARALGPDEEREGKAIRIIEGAEVVIETRSVPRFPSLYSIFGVRQNWRWDDKQVHAPTLLDELKEFLSEPKPKFESSLILPEGFRRQREAELQADRLTAFIQPKIDLWRNAFYLEYKQKSALSGVINEKAATIVILEEEIESLKYRIRTLEARKATIESRQIVDCGGRLFRVEE